MDDLFGADGVTPGDIDRLAAQLGDAEHAWPATLAELVDVLAHAWQRQGRPQIDAEREARLTVYLIARHCGGRQFYLPTGEALDRALRDTEIWQRYLKNESVRSLSRDKGITETQIYDILARQRALRIERFQGKLAL